MMTIPSFNIICNNEIYEIKIRRVIDSNSSILLEKFYTVIKDKYYFFKYLGPLSDENTESKTDIEILEEIKKILLEELYSAL